MKNKFNVLTFLFVLFLALAFFAWKREQWGLVALWTLCATLSELWFLLALVRLRKKLEKPKSRLWLAGDIMQNLRHTADKKAEAERPHIRFPEEHDSSN